LRAGEGRIGPLSGVSPIIAVPLALLAFELVHYTYHRASHELRGRLGDFLWRVHAVHHVPDKVYVLMHAVLHPLNGLIVRLTAMILPPALLGLGPEAVFLYTIVVSLQGFVTHWNVDVRVGFLNYVLVGAELHRMHHSADAREAKNFSAVLSIFDILFGTFVYRPGNRPERFGVEEPAHYPKQTDVIALLRLPFGIRPERAGIEVGEAQAPSK
jgi:sterol desaturase/sphingolipid hydroxylase (fatty acid hydroxylase superfamily)